MIVVAGGAVFSIVGSSEDSPTRAAPRPKIIPAPELNDLRVGSPRRVFLDYWSALQFHDWPAAVSQFEPDYLNFIGTATTITAMRSGASYYPMARPSDITTVSRGNTVSLRYLLPSREDGGTRETAVLHREGGRWRLVFDSALDNRFEITAQSMVQNSIDSQATKPSGKALQAGAAAGALQAKYQERLRRRAAKVRRRKRGQVGSSGPTPSQGKKTTGQ